MLKKFSVIALAGLALSFLGALAFAGPNTLTTTNAAGNLRVANDPTGVVTVPNDDSSTGEVKCWYVLHATGAGYAHLEGRGEVRIIAGGASLFVKNFSQTEVTVQGNGIKVPFPEQDAMLYIGYGGAMIKGEAVNIFLSALKAEIRAQGKGKAEFRGRWHYTVNKLCVAEAEPKQMPKPIPIETGKVTEAAGERAVTYGEE